MKKHLQTYSSFLLLLLFLFPLVQQQVHSLEHAEDIHCTATDKHFHNQEHNCSLCDYTVNKSGTSAINSFSFTIASSSFSFNPFIESVNVPLSFSDLPSRAPPVV